MIDICDEDFKPIHDEMILVARNASLWINEYFLDSPEVSYSGSLKKIVEGWQVDPCIERRRKRMEEEEAAKNEVKIDTGV